MKTEDIYVLDNLADWELGNSYIKPLAALFSRLQGYMDTAPQALTAASWFPEHPEKVPVSQSGADQSDHGKPLPSVLPCYPHLRRIC